MILAIPCVPLLVVLCGVFFFTQSVVYADRDVSLTKDTPRLSDAKSFPINRLGEEVEKQHKVDGPKIVGMDGGAQLSAQFQQLAGRVSMEGLWLESTDEENPKGQPFRVIATAIGRKGGTNSKKMAQNGKVEVSAELVSFTRPGLTEEYRVSVDGVRQDFVVSEAPSGAGELIVTLNVDGARLTPIDDGVVLTVKDSGREIAYSRLKVTDAEGRELSAFFSINEPSEMIISVDDDDAVYPVRIDPTFSDADWFGMYGTPGTDKSVFATAVGPNGDLYVGGSFTHMGQLAVNYIAVWRGISWYPFGSGFNGEVRSLAFSGNNLYVGGAFSQVGSLPVSCIACWDGNAWKSLGSGTNGVVQAIVVSGSNVYAGGSFSVAGGVNANGIAKWDGEIWSSLGSGTNGDVKALATSGGMLYAGGNFTLAGGNVVNHIARWNGVEWASMGQGFNAAVHAVAVMGTLVFAGGDFEASSSLSVKHIACWSGGSWAGVGQGMNNAVTSLAVSGSDLYIGGIFSQAGGITANHIVRWDGAEFSPLGEGVDGAVNAVAVYSGNVYAVGDFTSAGNLIANRIGHWDGAVWRALAPGINGSVHAIAIAGDDVYVGGEFGAAGGLYVSGVAHWNGSSWNRLGSEPLGSIYSLLAFEDTVIAGGLMHTTLGGAVAVNIARWDGSRWHAMGEGLGGTVGCLAKFKGDIYAGGGFLSSGQQTVPRLAKWNGNSWTALAASPNEVVTCLGVSGDYLYVGGLFTQVGSLSTNHIARWDGFSWSSLGVGTDDTVQDIAVSTSDVFVCGSFGYAGDVRAKRIARWDGDTWHPLQSSVDVAGVSSIVASGPYIYAAGLFKFSSINSSRIVRWNGREWQPLGTSANNPVFCLESTDTDLYAGGSFTHIGSKAVGRIAHAVLPPEPEISVRGNALEILSEDMMPNMEDHTVFETGNVGGAPVGRTFTILNLANADLALIGENKVTITGLHAADFSVSTQPVNNIEAFSSCPFNISFHPTGIGLRRAEVHIANDDANENPYFFTIEGQAVAPEIYLTGNANEIPDGISDPDEINHTYFGETILGFPLHRHFTINNSGDGDLYIEQVKISGIHAADFSIESSPSMTVNPSGLSQFGIRFNPSGTGLRKARVEIFNSDSDESTYIFEIEGHSSDLKPVAQPQTILFAPPAKVYLGQVEIPVQATSTSGLPVTLTVLSGPATLGNNTLTFTGGVGPVKIRASQEGNVFFKAAKPVDRIITIQEDPTTLTLANLVQTYTGTPRAITTLGAAVAVVTYNNDPLAPPPTQAGKYPVKAVAGGVTRTGMLIITKAPLTVIPDFQRKLVSQPNPVLTLAYQGLLGADTVEAAMSVAPVGKTTAKGTSPAGSYPITPGGGVSANYSFIYVKGTLFVEGFAGQYEALLTDELGDAKAKLEMTIAAANSTFTGKITSAMDAKTVPVTGGLTTSFASESAAGMGSGKSGSTMYQVTVNVPLEGDLTVSATRDGAALGSALDGKKLLVLVKPATLSYTGAHTLRLAPATGGAVMPAGSGHATAKVNANGSLAIVGKLADGTTLTATLASDREAGYRLFALPYKVRPGSYLAGKFNLLPQPDLPGRRHVSQASGTLLLWAKAGKATDTSYRDGFGTVGGPLETQLTIDPWLPPVAAKGAAPAVTLAQRLGLAGSALGVVHGTIDSTSAIGLPTSVSLGSNHAVTILLPVTSPLNATGWKVTLVPSTGAFTGSFLLKDEVAGKPAPRPVKFSGVLRQTPSAELGGIVGAGHFLLPALPGAASNEMVSGEIRFVRP